MVLIPTFLDLMGDGKDNDDKAISSALDFLAAAKAADPQRHKDDPFVPFLADVEQEVFLSDEEEEEDEEEWQDWWKKTKHLPVCSTEEWVYNRQNPIEVAKWADKIAAKMLSVLWRWWIVRHDNSRFDGTPLALFKIMLQPGKHLKLGAQALAEKFAQYGCCTHQVQEITRHALQDAAAAVDESNGSYIEEFAGCAAIAYSVKLEEDVEKMRLKGVKSKKTYLQKGGNQEEHAAEEEVAMMAVSPPPPDLKRTQPIPIPSSRHLHRAPEALDFSHLQEEEEEEEEPMEQLWVCTLGEDGLTCSNCIKLLRRTYKSGAEMRGKSCVPLKKGLE